MSRSSLADFVLEGKLGSGSFGTVYKVTRKHDGRQYALKEIDLRSMSEQQQEDCIAETTVLAALDSPYIIKFYDSFLQKGKLYICMEYASGGNLYDYIRQQTLQLPEEKVWQLFIQMLLGLGYMHGKKVLHRDFKTANVFLDDKLNVRLGDLGVAKVLSDRTQNARTLIGTPYYLSPEMCEDKPYDEKSDVWALGVGLYECCARKHPFDAGNQGSLMLKIMRGKYAPVTGYSKDLTDIVKSCLTLDASKRPGTNSLLALKSVRERAKQLDIDLPPLALPPSRGLSPNPPSTGHPSRPSITAAKLPSRRASSSAAALEQPAAARPPSRSPTPPALGRVASARAPASVAKVDLAAELLLNGPPGAADSRPPVRSRRQSRAEDAPGMLSAGQAGQVVKQLQGLKVDSAAPCARRSTVDSIPAGVAACSSGPVQPAGDVTASQADATTPPAATSSCERAHSSSSSHGTVTSRSSSKQQTLSEVKAQIIEMVGPLAFDALLSVLSTASDPQSLQQGIKGSSSTSCSTGNAGANHCGTPEHADHSSQQQQQQLLLLSAMERVLPGRQTASLMPLLAQLMQQDGWTDRGGSPNA